MANPRLTSEQLALANDLLNNIRQRLDDLSESGSRLHGNLAAPRSAAGQERRLSDVIEIEIHRPLPSCLVLVRRAAPRGYASRFSLKCWDTQTLTRCGNMTEQKAPSPGPSGLALRERIVRPKLYVQNRRMVTPPSLDAH